MFTTVTLAAKAVLVAALSSSHAYTVQPGDTLSEIAAQHGTTLSAVEAANPQVGNPDLIYAGQVISLVAGSSSTETEPDGDADDAPAAPATHHSTNAASPSSVPSGDLASVPGVPRSFAACVALRESSNLADPNARGNAYGIIPASGYNGYAMSLAQQKQAFAQLYAQYGTAPWQPSDGCS
jgi:hypothetical protein